MAGLLDFFGLGGGSDPSSGLLSSDPQAAAAALQADMRNQQLAGMAAALLKSSGPSFMPHSFGQDIGNAILGGVQGRQNALSQAVAQQKLHGLLTGNALNDLTLNYYKNPDGGAAVPGKDMGVASGLVGPANPAGQPAIFSGGDLAPQMGPANPSILPGQIDQGDNSVRLPVPSYAGQTAPLPSAAGQIQPLTSSFAAPPQMAPSAVAGALPVPGQAAPIFDRAAMAQKAAGMFRVPGLAPQAVEMLKLANQGMPEGAYYGQDGALHAMPGYDQYVLDKSTNETMGKNLQTRDANGNIINQPGAVAANSAMAGGVEYGKSQGGLPAELAKIGATGAQTRKTEEFKGGITPAEMIVPVLGPDRKPTFDASGQPIYQKVQTTQLAKARAGNVGAGPSLTPQQEALLKVEGANLTAKTVRSQEGSVIPGTGAITAGLPVAPAPQGAPVAPARPPSVLWRSGAPASGPAAAPVATPQSASTAQPGTGGFTPGYGIPHALIAAETESGKGRADAMNAWGQTAVANQSLQQQLGALTEVAQRYNTGKLSPGATDVGGWIAALGLDPSKTLGDPANGEEFNKAASNLITRTIQASSSNPAHALWGTIEAGSPTAEKRPETNHDLVAQLSARANWESDLYAAAAEKFKNGVPSVDFVNEFTKAHPQKEYLDQARAAIPPFAGMSGSVDKPITVMGAKIPAKPLPNRWYVGKAVPGGKAMVNPDGTGWWVPSGQAQ
jgi:hypothetical protein